MRIPSRGSAAVRALLTERARRERFLSAGAARPPFPLESHAEVIQTGSGGGMERLFFVSLVVTGAGWLRALDPESCTIGTFRCGDRKEVSLCSRCDRHPDCDDASDESHCHAGSVLCGPRGWQCDGQGPCLPRERICDGHRDCPDGSDEAGDNCKPQGAEPACDTDEFRCAPGAECFPVTWVCDGHADCLDERDELGCESHFPGTFPETPETPVAGGPNPEDMMVISIVALLAVLLFAVSAAVWIHRGVLHLPSSSSWDQESVQPLAKGQP